MSKFQLSNYKPLSIKSGSKNMDQDPVCGISRQGKMDTMLGKLILKKEPSVWYLFVEGLFLLSFLILFYDRRNQIQF